MVNHEIVFGLVIFLTVGTVLLMFAVVCIVLYNRKLVKRIEEQLFADSNLVQKVTVRKNKRTRYTPSQRNGNEIHELSFYESPPLTDAQRERLQNNQMVDEDGTKFAPTVPKPKLKASASYIEFINAEPTRDGPTHVHEDTYDDLCIENFDQLAPDYVSRRKTPYQEEFYTEPNQGNDDGVLKALSQTPVNSRHAVQYKALDSRQDNKQNKPTGRKTPIPSQNPVNVTRIQYNRKPKPVSKPSKPLAPHGTQQKFVRNAINALPKSHVDGKVNKGFAQTNAEEVYGNEDIIQEERKRALENTGNPNLHEDDSYYGNQVIIDNQANNNQIKGDTGYPDSNYVCDEPLYGNQEIFAGIQEQELYENCIKEDSLYGNFDC